MMQQLSQEELLPEEDEDNQGASGAVAKRIIYTKKNNSPWVQLSESVVKGIFFQRGSSHSCPQKQSGKPLFKEKTVSNIMHEKESPLDIFEPGDKIWHNTKVCHAFEE